MHFRWIGLLIAVVAACGIVAYYAQQPTLAPATQQASTSTAPVTTTAVVVAPKPPPMPRTLFDVLRREQPAVAATQPLGVPVELGDAARFVLHHPIYLDEAGHLWLTHPEAEPLQAVLRGMARPGAPTESTHVVQETARFVYWTHIDGKIAPAVFVESSSGTLGVVTAQRRLALPAQRSFQFARAVSTANYVAIPCNDGISVLHIDKEITEQFVSLPTSKDPLAQPQVIQGLRGLLAWTPATQDHAGSGVSRYLDDAWTPLDPKDWPTSIVQVSPFLDGTVQQLRQAAEGKIEIAPVLLDTPVVDEKQILALIEQLDDLSEAVRNKAYENLQRIGPSAWPIFRKVMDDQLPEAKQRLELLLAGSNTPSIGPMTSIDGKLRVVARFNNGGVLLYGDAGVTIPQPDHDEDATVSPAWICVRPDRSPELLTGLLTDDLQPGKGDLLPISGDWYRTDATMGPRRFIGNALLPMVRSSEKKFWMPVGSDRRGRWLFREPGKESPTLLIDPTIQDVTPRLPVWTIRVKNGSAGWTKEGWPAIKRGGVWALRETNWFAADNAEALITNPPPAPAAPSNGPTTAPSNFLLTDFDDRNIYDGKTALRSIARKVDRSWPLPAAATGVDPVTMVETPDQKLFLFNQPGRVLRIANTPNGAEPFKLEATFTRNIPNDQPVRIWVDPAGRICMAYESSISVLFPSGVLPHEIAVKMSAEELAANQPE